MVIRGIRYTPAPWVSLGDDGSDRNLVVPVVVVVVLGKLCNGSVIRFFKKRTVHYISYFHCQESDTDTHPRARFLFLSRGGKYFNELDKKESARLTRARKRGYTYNE